MSRDPLRYSSRRIHRRGPHPLLLGSSISGLLWVLIFVIIGVAL